MSMRRLLLAFFASSAAATAYASLETCLKSTGISGEIVLPTDSNYTNASAPVNRALMYKPAGIVFLATPADATAALACAAQAGVSVVSRSARHNYASFSEGGRDGSLVLDTTRLDSVTYDAATGYATVGLGNRLGNLALTLNKTGRATPHGTCAFVGAGGHALCGGFGMWSRQHGLFLDQHVSAQVVIANGSVVTASRNQNSDLFWALRGAGPSFGTVLSVTIKTYPQPDTVTRFVVTFPNIASVDTAAKFFSAFQDFASSQAPPELGIRIQISLSGSSFTSVRIHGVYYGPTANFTTAFQPLLNALPVAPTSQNIRSMTYIQSVTDLEQTGQLNTTGKGLQTWTGYRKSFLVPSAQPLSLTTWTKFANYSIKEPKSGMFLWAEIDAFGGSYGGEPTFIPSVPEDDAAFNGRESVLLMQFGIDGFGTFGDSAYKWANGWAGSISTNVAAENKTLGAFACYVDSKFTADEAHAAYYGAAKTAKLKEIKQRWDPKNVFSYPHAL